MTVAQHSNGNYGTRVKAAAARHRARARVRKKAELHSHVRAVVRLCMPGSGGEGEWKGGMEGGGRGLGRNVTLM